MYLFELGSESANPCSVLTRDHQTTSPRYSKDFSIAVILFFPAVAGALPWVPPRPQPPAARDFGSRSPRARNLWNPGYGRAGCERKPTPLLGTDRVQRPPVSLPGAWHYVGSGSS